VIAHEVDSLSPDETALYSPAHRALAVGDGVIRRREDGALGFVPDRFMDDPEGDKAGLRAAYERLLDLDFDLLLLAHGDPVVGDARATLGRFLDG
jgi:glyoxylase-like metal-dependent hydrolase (beta-lactamase superfamily II)